MALADVADVTRVLRLTGTSSTRDEQLRESLEAAHDWYYTRKGRPYDQADPLTEKYFDVYEDAIIHLTRPIRTVSAIRVYSLQLDTSESALDPENDWEQVDDFSIRLRPNLTVTPFERVRATRMPSQYDRVEVDYTPLGVVPADVRDGIALLAGGMWFQNPNLAKGLNSESIGGYSYSITQPRRGVDTGYVASAMKLLAPHLKRKVSVV